MSELNPEKVAKSVKLILESEHAEKLIVRMQELRAMGEKPMVQVSWHSIGEKLVFNVGLKRHSGDVEEFMSLWVGV